MERRHLKIKGEYLPEEKLIRIEVVEQTHFQGSFSKYGECIFTATGGETLIISPMCGGIKNTCKGFFSARENEIWFYVAERETRIPNEYCEVPVAWWERIKSAVEEYNSIHSGD